MLDCLIIGGGPAGLTAATYLARYRRAASVIDAGDSPARQIPISHNYPGFKGIGGQDLLERLRDQALTYGADLRRGEVSALSECEGGFLAIVGNHRIEARSILMATGLVDKTPSITGNASSLEAIRYCPVCDGYEAIERRIGVLGSLEDAGKKGRFLRTYSRDVSVFATDFDLDEAAAASLRADGVKLFASDGGVSIVKDIVHVNVTRGIAAVDVLYPALGCTVHSQMAVSLGAGRDNVGCLKVDDHQETTVKQLYAAGDVVTDLHQLSVAIGHAAVAATAIHNWLPANPI